MKNSIQDLRLLPNYFKKIALAILVFSILLLIGFKVIPLHSPIFREISYNGVLISLLLLAITRDKTEDERTIKLRLQSFAAAFIFGVVIVIVNPYINLLFDGSYFSNKGSGELLFSMLAFYFIVFYNAKRSK